MNKVKIDGVQLFCIIVLFLLGTTIFLDVGTGAKQDTWIVTLISPIFGLVFYTIYYQLYKQYPNLPLTEYVKKIWGKYIGSIVSYLYIVYFIYIAARVLRDLEELLVSSPYKETSIMTIGICIMFVLIYAVHLGLEVFARVTIICFIIVNVTVFLINILYIVGNVIQLENVLPILAEGWKPVLNELIPLSITVPYGELIILSILFPYISKKTNILKVGINAVVIAGLYLTVNALLLICILGPDLLDRSVFPALAAVGYINIAGFIQRLDTFIIILIVLLGFVKISLFFFCTVIGINQLFKIQPNVLTNYSLGVFIFYFQLSWHQAIRVI